MPYPPCPPFKYMDDHLNQSAHLNYLIDTMAWFSFWTNTGIDEFNRRLPDHDMPRRKQVDNEADIILKQDPIMNGMQTAFPSTREQVEMLFERCRDMGTREIRTAVDAALRAKYSSIYVQWLINEKDVRYGSDINTTSRIMNESRWKSNSFLRRYTDPASPPPFIPRQVNHDIERSKQGCASFRRVGHAFLYWDEIRQDVVQCEIIGLGEEPGEEWFAINKTAGERTVEDVVTAEQLDILLLHEL